MAMMITTTAMKKILPPLMMWTMMSPLPMMEEGGGILGNINGGGKYSIRQDWGEGILFVFKFDISQFGEGKITQQA